MKKIVLFSDGTGSSSSAAHKTNVWRAYQALDRRPGSMQVAFYDNGVGTSSFRPFAILGLAFGFGLARNVQQIYRFVCQTYREGDEIYGFGFSRGAFTMRVVAAMICSQGIVDIDKVKDERELDRWVSAAYHRFRKDSFTPSLLSYFLRPVRDVLFGVVNKLSGRRPYNPGINIGYEPKSESGQPADQEAGDPLIKFLGVWDTVDAYGLPIDEFTRAWDMVVWPLTARERNCPARIERACQALALDEQRESFEPALWNEDGKPLPEMIDSERVSQVWFAGVHSNVGGSYPDDSMALVPLNWMLEQSEKNEGLTFLPDERQRFLDKANANAPLYDSRGGAGTFFRYAPRNLERLCHEKRPGLANWLKSWLPAGLKDSLSLAEVEANEVHISTPKIHYTVFERIEESGDGYAPINLPEDYAVVRENGQIDQFATAQADMPEEPEEPETRRSHQAYIWNKVWALKLQYVLTFITIVLWIAYPYIRGESSGRVGAIGDSILGAFSDEVRQIPSLIGKIPGLGFAEGWAAAYAQFPYAFIVFILLICLLWGWQHRTQTNLKSEMRRAWHHLSGKGHGLPSPKKIGAFRESLATFLDSSVDSKGKLKLSIGSRIARWLRIISEALAVLVILFVIARIGLFVVDSSGGLCEIETAQPRPLGETVTFQSKSTCFDTGFELEAGQTYLVDIKIPRGWSDSTIAADVNGWSRLSKTELDELKMADNKPSDDKDGEEAFKQMQPAYWYMSFATPLRRHLSVDWYAPMAKVDDSLFDWHLLEEAVTADDEEQEDEEEKARPLHLKAELMARRSGRIFLYLNDAVLPLPFLFDWFYNNNNGDAKVTVDELPAEGTGETEDKTDATDDPKA